MAKRMVSMKHPHFPEDAVFGIEGVGQLTNDGTPIEVDEEEFERRTGSKLEDAFANDATVTVEGSSSSGKSSVPVEDLLKTSPSEKKEEGSET